MPTSTFRLHPRSYVVPVLGLSGVIIALGALVVTGVAPDPRLFFAAAPAVVRVVQIATMRIVIDDRHVRATWGWLWTSDTTIPLDRVQDVEIQRSLLARILGLTQVVVSSAGGSGTIKLSYFDAPSAEGFRASLAAAGLEHPEPVAGSPGGAGGPGSSGFGASGAGSPAFGASGVEHPVHQVALREIVRSVAGGVAMVVLVTIVAVAVAIVWHPAALVAPVLAAPAVAALGVSVWLTIGAGVSVVVGGLVRLRQGVITLRSSSTPLARVQLLKASAGPIYQAFGWEKVEFRSADAAEDKAEQVRAVLSPGDVRGAMRGYASVMLGGAVDASAERPIGSRVRRSTMARLAFAGSLALAVWVMLVLCAASVVALLRAAGSVDANAASGAAWATWGVGALGAVTIVVASALVGWLAGMVRDARSVFGVDAGMLVVSDGVYRLQTKLIPLSKVQAVEVRSSPPQRWCDTASVVLDVAGVSGRWTVQIVDMDAGDAESLASFLAGAAAVSALPDGV